MLSLLRLFPSYRMLEEQVRELKAQNETLLNRLIYAYSGYELRQAVPTYADALAASNKAPTEDKVLGTGIHSNFDLLRELEEASLKESEGISDITIAAARSRAEQENLEAAEEYTARLEKARNAAKVDNGLVPV